MTTPANNSMNLLDEARKFNEAWAIERNLPIKRQYTHEELEGALKAVRAAARGMATSIPGLVAMNAAMKVWWIPQIPGKAFEVHVGSVEEARKLLDVLARYDAFQFENNIKPDYCNAGGLMVFEDGDWTEWADEWGNDIDHTATQESA